MSQRLLITLKKNVTEEDNFYDCIYTEDSELKDLMLDWCMYDSQTGFYCGPWKTTTRDRNFFDKFMEDFSQIKRYIPELKSLSDCWGIYEDDKELKK